MRSIREMLEDMGMITPEVPGKPGKEKDHGIRTSKHWIVRNGIKIRATKKYADGRQKG